MLQCYLTRDHDMNHIVQNASSGIVDVVSPMPEMCTNFGQADGRDKVIFRARVLPSCLWL